MCAVTKVERMLVLANHVRDTRYDRGSIIVGRSVHYQRIEKMWHNVFNAVTALLSSILFNERQRDIGY